MVFAHRLLRTWQRQIDLFAAPSEATRQEYIKAGFPAERIVVQPDYIDERPAPAPRPREGFLFAGRLEPAKGIETLLDAWDLLAAQGTPPELRIAGRGELDGRVRERAANNPYIRHEGQLPREDVLEAMAAATALIFPSEWLEPFGVTILEAYANKLPVIAAPVGAPGELVLDGLTGLFFEAGNATDLAAKVGWAIAHPDEMGAMGQAGRAEYESKYTPDRNFELLMAVYELALSLHRD